MLDNTAVRWMIGIVAVAAIVALLAYARGDDGNKGRDPRGDSLGAVTLVVET